MSDALVTSGVVSIYLKDMKRVYTVGDVRAWLKAVDTFGLPDTHSLEECYLALTYLSSAVEPVRDGEDYGLDFLVKVDR